MNVDHWGELDHKHTKIMIIMWKSVVKQGHFSRYLCNKRTYIWMTSLYMDTVGIGKAWDLR